MRCRRNFNELVDVKIKIETQRECWCLRCSLIFIWLSFTVRSARSLLLLAATQQHALSYSLYAQMSVSESGIVPMICFVSSYCFCLLFALLLLLLLWMLVQFLPLTLTRVRLWCFKGSLITARYRNPKSGKREGNGNGLRLWDWGKMRQLT